MLKKKVGNTGARGLKVICPEKLVDEVSEKGAWYVLRKLVLGAESFLRRYHSLG